MPRYDYSARGCYFVTICQKKMETNSFGKITDGKIEFSQFGEIANRCWLEIPLHFSNIRLDEFAIMPNHIHGIIVILPKAEDTHIYSKFSDQISDRSKMDLSKIIQAFKASVTREINKTQHCDYFAWQKSFYDHIIHSRKELFQIRKYIYENPINNSDDFFSEIKHL